MSIRLPVKTVYLAYPYSDDPTTHRKEIIGIVERLVAARPDLIPFVPHLAFDGFEEKFRRDYAMKCAKELLSKADLLCLAIPRANSLSPGMRVELEFAEKARIPHMYLEELLAAAPAVAPSPDSVSMTYAWAWFSYHAEQRLRAFNFFLIIVGFLFVAYFAALERGTPFLGMLIAGFGALMSVGFWILDIRNTELVNCGRVALDDLEKGLGLHIRNDDEGRKHFAKSLGSFSKQLYRKDGEYSKNKPPAVSTHTFWLRVIHLASFVVFVAASGFAALALLRSLGVKVG